MLKFSIIICNYNYGKYIKQAIDSVLNQTHDDFELIIVDDGSTDNSKEVIETITDVRVKKVFKENGGQASAFNKGFDLAKGSWIAFLDSDDWWEKDKLERIANYLDALPKDIALLQHQLYDSDGEIQVPYKRIIPSGDVFEEMINTQKLDFFIPTSGMLIPKSVGLKIFPIPVAFWFSADAYIMRTAVVHGKLFSVPEYLGYHRVHSNSFTNGILKDSSKLFEILIPNLNSYYKSQGIKPLLKDKKSKYEPSFLERKKSHLYHIYRGIKKLILD